MVKHGARETDIAAKLGMSFPTWHRLKQERADIQQAMAEGNSHLHEQVFGMLYKRAMDGDTIAILFLLKSRFAYKEGTTQEVNHNVRVSFELPASLSADHYSKLISPTPDLIEHDD